MGFQLVPKVVTLNEVNGRYFASFQTMSSIVVVVVVVIVVVGGVFFLKCDAITDDMAQAAL